MRTPAEYAQEHGIVPQGQITGQAWFGAHPDAMPVMVECRDSLGWSWEQILRYFQDEWGFPLKDWKSIHRVYVSR